MLFFLQGRDGLFRVIVAILMLSEEDLLQLDMEYMLKVHTVEPLYNVHPRDFAKWPLYRGDRLIE